MATMSWPERRRPEQRESLQNRERTGVPERAARLGWWDATGSYIQPPIYNFVDVRACTTQLSCIRSLLAPGSVTSTC